MRFVRMTVKVALRITTVIFATCGVVFIACWLWPARHLPPPDYLNFVGSPDGKFRAVIATWAGGGAISPSCYDRIFVVSEATGVDRLVDEDNAIFESECARFALQNGAVRNSPELSWRDGKVLMLRFAMHRPDARRPLLRLPRLVASGEFAVEFEAAE